MSDIDWKERCLLAEDARYAAEAKLARERADFSNRLDELRELRKQVGGMFFKRDAREVKTHPLVKSFWWSDGGFGFEVADKAIYAGICRSTHYTLTAIEYHVLPRRIEAQNWWHLCAQIGISEIVARVLYVPPDNR